MALYIHDSWNFKVISGVMKLGYGYIWQKSTL